MDNYLVFIVFIFCLPRGKDNTSSCSSYENYESPSFHKSHTLFEIVPHLLALDVLKHCILISQASNLQRSILYFPDAWIKDVCGNA